MNTPASPFLPHGGYRTLRSYKVAEAVHDATVVFCRRFYAHDRRMSDQMVQAARSGVRNIIESGPACPRCGQPMVKRIARIGPKANQPFWGCSGYPDCRATLAVSPPEKPDQPDGRSRNGGHECPLA